MKYLGNKARLLEFLKTEIDLKNRVSQTCLDLFSGTCSVSQLFKSHGCLVESVDNLDFCHKRAVAMSFYQKGHSSQHLDELSKKKHKGFVYKKYSESSGVCIFKDSIAEHIDGANLEIQNLFSSGVISFEEFCYLKTCLIEEADFRSNIMGSYESFYKAGWRKQCSKAWSIEDLDLVNGPQGTSSKMDVIDFLKKAKGHYDFIYADPPYNSRQYSTNFHLLETISLDDNPEIFGKINRRKDNVRSEFCYKKKAKNNFIDLSRLTAKITDEFFMSYSTEGIVPIEELIDIFKVNFSSVNFVSKQYRRFKTNSKTELKTGLEEILIIAKK